MTGEPTGGGSEAVCLLIHDFGGSRRHMAALAAHLEAHGFATRTVSLPGHDLDPSALEFVSSDDWAGACQDALDELRGRYASIYVIGLCTGGLLGVLLARQDADVHGLVLVSTFTRLRRKLGISPRRLFPWVPYSLAAIALRLGSGFLHRFVAPERLRAFHFPAKRPNDPHAHFAGYSHFPLSALVSELQLLKDVDPAFPMVKARALCIQSRNDYLASAAEYNRLFRRLGSSDKAQVWVDGRVHYLLSHDLTQDAVFERILRFLLDVDAQRTRRRDDAHPGIVAAGATRRQPLEEDETSAR